MPSATNDRALALSGKLAGGMTRVGAAEKAAIERLGVRVIEDAALAIGSRVGTQPVGAVGDLVSFSFHPNKNMTTIEGGNERVDLNAKDKIAQAQAEERTQRERDSARSAGATDSAGEARNPQGEGRSAP